MLPLLMASCRDRATPFGKGPTMDPQKILFSTPTLCDPAPAVDALPTSSGARSLHEDDWRQIEFVVSRDREYIQQQLAAVAAFKEAKRQGPGWTEVYIRKEHPTPLAALRLASKDLPTLSTAGLVIGGGPPWGGTVRGGFALSDGGDWFLYGQRSNDGHVLELAVSPGHKVPSEKFAHTLSQLSQTANVLLVDWYACSFVDTSSTESVLMWAHRYCHPQP